MEYCSVQKTERTGYATDVSPSRRDASRRCHGRHEASSGRDDIAVDASGGLQAQRQNGPFPARRHHPAAVAVLCAVADPGPQAASGGGGCGQTPGGHALAAQRASQQLGGTSAQGRGAGLQPGRPRGNGAPLPEERLVQDAAAAADRERGGLQQPHGHQPLLLRPVQLVLHPAGRGRPPRRARLPVVRLLQAAAGRHARSGAGLPGPPARRDAQAGAAHQAVPLHVRKRRRLSSVAFRFCRRSARSCLQETPGEGDDGLSWLSGSEMASVTFS